MKIKYGAIVADGSGKLSGNVFARNGSGSYVRKWVKPVNPNTPSQAGNRSVFGTLATTWRNLSQTQKDTWIGNKGQYPLTDRLGETLVLSGFQLFMKCNKTLVSAGEVQITSLPPSPSDLAVGGLDQDALSAAPWTVTAGDWTTGTVKFNPVAGIAGSQRIVLYASAQVGEGVNSVNSVPLKRIGTYSNSDLTSGVANVLADWIAVYGESSGEVNSYGKIFFKAVTFSVADGFAVPFGSGYVLITPA